MAACRLNGKAGTLHLTIEQGATYDPVLTWGDENGAPIDLTGYIARMQIRASVEAVTTIHEATTANGQLVMGGAAGTVTFNIPAVDTAAMDFEEAVYDLEVESAGGHVTRLVEGSVYLSPEVTR
jgi:hypothetical protein